MKKIKIHKGNCLDVMEEIRDKSIALILADLPYNITAQKWDIIIPFDKLWKQYERIIEDNGTIVLFGRQPFTSALIMSNTKLYRYSWIWNKGVPSDFLNSSFKPLNETEDIAIFSKATIGSLSKNKIRYYPQGIVEINKVQKNNHKIWRENKGYKGNNILSSGSSFVQKFTNHPKNTLHFKKETGLHPSQKPVDLLEYLIKTYTFENELVLDNTMGSGSTMIACIKTNRQGIGIEKDKKYFDISKERIDKFEIS